MDTENNIEQPNSEINLLAQNYDQMDEAGKNKLKEVSDQFLKIWEVINEEK